MRPGTRNDQVSGKQKCPSENHRPLFLHLAIPLPGHYEAPSLHGTATTSATTPRRSNQILWPIDLRDHTINTYAEKHKDEIARAATATRELPVDTRRAPNPRPARQAPVSPTQEQEHNNGVPPIQPVRSSASPQYRTPPTLPRQTSLDPPPPSQDFPSHKNRSSVRDGALG